MFLGALTPEEEVLARAPVTDFLTGSRPASRGGSTAPCLFLSFLLHPSPNPTESSSVSFSAGSPFRQIAPMVF